MLIKKAKTLLKVAILSTSGVSRFARGIFGLAKIVIGNLLDKWDTLEKSAQAPYFPML